MHQCGKSQEIRSMKQMNKLRKFNYILQQFQMYPQDFFPVLLENILSLSPFCLSLPMPRHLYFSDISPIYCLYCMRAMVLTLQYRKHTRQRSLSSSKTRIPWFTKTTEQELALLRLVFSTEELFWHIHSPWIRWCWIYLPWIRSCPKMTSNIYQNFSLIYIRLFLLSSRNSSLWSPLSELKKYHPETGNLFA